MGTGLNGRGALPSTRGLPGRSRCSLAGDQTLHPGARRSSAPGDALTALPEGILSAGTWLNVPPEEQASFMNSPSGTLAHAVLLHLLRTLDSEGVAVFGESREGQSCGEEGAVDARDRMLGVVVGTGALPVRDGCGGWDGADGRPAKSVSTPPHPPSPQVRTREWSPCPRRPRRPVACSRRPSTPCA